MSANTDGRPDKPLHTPQRRDRAIRLRRRITTTLAASGVGTVAAFGFLAATHSSGAAVATSPAPASSSSSTSATPAPTVAAATANPTATAAPTSAAVTGGSG
jgi:hypothetical protein